MRQMVKKVYQSSGSYFPFWSHGNQNFEPNIHQS